MTNWRMIASRARNYAKKIEEPSYSSKKVDIMDINASEALTQAYNYCGSEASVHTYNGGRQIIDTFHADGAQNHFDSEGENTSGDNDMDRDVFDYMSNLNESNNNNIMRNKIRINEATFKRIIAESVKGVLNEISPELMGAAAMTAAHRAQNTDDPYYNAKYNRQANAFASNAANSYEKENPLMNNVTFDPYDRNIGASFKRNSNRDYLVNIHGIDYECVDAGFGTEQPVDVVIRPEDVDFVPIGKTPLHGVVTNVLFMGVHYEFTVDCDGRIFKVHSTDFVPVGETVGIEVLPDAIHIMKPERKDEPAKES